MFGGYGNIQPLLRNNKNLLRKKSIFKKGNSPADKKKNLEGLYQGELSFKKVSKYQLNRVKRSIRTQIQNDNKKLQIALIVILTTATAISIGLFIYFKAIANEKALKNNELNKKEYLDKYLPKFNFVIQDGDRWLAKKQYKNAIYQYNKALEYFPDNSLAKEKLNIAYKERCKYSNIDCDKVN